MLLARISTFIILLASLVFYTQITQASINPFKKSKDLVFGEQIAWHFQDGAAAKTGSSKKGSDVLYYHINITENLMRLRLSKNDPTGAIPNTRNLSKLSIVDVTLDGQRFDLFQYCLDNQDRVDKKLGIGSQVAQDACLNSGDDDFVMMLDEMGLMALKSSQELVFIIEPYGRPIKLKYDMTGFNKVMQKLHKPAVVAVKAKAKPVAKPRPVVKKAVKMCLAQPPADFKKIVKAYKYPCDNAAQKAKAEQVVARQVEKEQKKVEQEMAQLRLQQEAEDKASKSSEKEAIWAAKQSAMWIKRCERHWAKGVSPCYCEKYLESAPAGVTNSCGK